ncbi:MAG TPA: hypothetical protein VFD82_15880 [Planctomycetota bacterium]|nr:hypothetical protein [Planctomycetota bacterium]
MLAPETGAAFWSRPKRVLFRFVFVYLILYILPFPLELIPETKPATDGFETASNAVLAWFGKNVLFIGQDLAPFDTGSGDTTRDYVALAMHTTFAVIIAGIWSLLGRRSNHARLADLLRTYVRFMLGVTMLGYGNAKFFGGQFSSSDGLWLVSTWGDSSPMGVVWNFMAASPVFTAFTGIAECLGGVLLFWRRTTTLGAMLISAMMLTVVLINFCYDVPVKLHSVHLLLMSIGLLLRDAPRLADVLLWHRASQPLPLRLPLSRWIFWPERLVKFACVCWILFSYGQPIYVRWENRGAPAGPLDGLYEVAEFVRDGAVVPPLPDAARWQHVLLSRTPYFPDYPVQEIAELAMSDGKTRACYQLSVDAAQSTVTLKQQMRPGSEAQASPPIVLKYRRETPGAAGKPVEAAAPADRPTAVEAPAKPEQGKTTEPTTTPAPAPTTVPTPAPTPSPAAVAEPALLVLEGTYNGAAITVRLRELRGDSFLLRNRGFHWINEYPFNR